MTEEFPQQLRQFITESIDSVAELEVLLLLRADPAHTWLAHEVGQALYTSSDITETQLKSLHSRHLIDAAPNGRYSYRAGGESALLIDQLAQLYQDRRVAVITAIYAKPVDTIRSFSDAFRFRKDR